MTDIMSFTADGLPAAQEALFSPEEKAQIQARLWTLLTKQERLHTQGDHSSLREEKAAELLNSIVFSLQYHLQQKGLPMRTLLAADPAMLRQAQQALQIEVHTADTLYRMAMRSVVTFGSVSLADTLANIGMFFKRYDVCLHAHDIPASIDYPLCHPVPETLRGVLYIRAYLERLLTENKLIRRFASGRVEMLLRRASPDYRELLQNLYEPVAANVVGLALLGGKEKQLEIIPAQAEQIHHRIAVLGERQGRDALRAAAVDACRGLALTDPDSIAYLSQAAEALYPRLAVSPQSAAGAFSAC